MGRTVVSVIGQGRKGREPERSGAVRARACAVGTAAGRTPDAPRTRTKAPGRAHPVRSRAGTAEPAWPVPRASWPDHFRPAALGAVF